MDKNYLALMMLDEYIQHMDIDYFAIPEMASKNINVVLIPARDFCAMIKEWIEKGDDTLPSLLKIEKGEMFFRIARKYHATKMWEGFNRLRKKRFATPYKRVAEIPPHCNMIARGWEVVVANIIHSEHTGDDINNVDVISTLYGRIECKIGGGRLYTASKME